MDHNAERLRRWRLVLGEPAAGGTCSLSGDDVKRDAALGSLYDADRRGSLANSSPNVNRWLGDIRTYFPQSSVQLMQRDAWQRLGLTRMLLEPETLANITPDIHLAATLLSLGKVIPEETKATARQVVQRVADEIERRLRNRLVQAVRGSLNRAIRNRRPRLQEIDWDRTIRTNLKNYQPEHRTIIAEKLVGYGRRRSSLRDVVLCVDQSGSMAPSVVYSGILGSVLASIRALRTRMVVFDTAVVDLTDELEDPVDLLFGVQLGGGTDIAQALAYCQTLVSRPSDTVLVLITDLYEGGDAQAMIRRAAALAASGVLVVCLLALSDQGCPSYDADHAAALSQLGIPCFACTPDAFPDLMAAALQREDLARWAARNEIAVAGGGGK